MGLAAAGTHDSDRAFVGLGELVFFIILDWPWIHGLPDGGRSKRALAVRDQDGPRKRPPAWKNQRPRTRSFGF